MLAGLLGASGVAIGAYHAHGLEKRLTRQGFDRQQIDDQLHQCDTGVRYQMYHALALLAVGVLLAVRSGAALHVAGALFVLGVLLFSGGLYWMVFFENRVHWAIVPSGGLLLVSGWLALAIAALQPCPVGASEC